MPENDVLPPQCLNNPTSSETRLVKTGNLTNLPYSLTTTDEVWAAEYAPGNQAFAESAAAGAYPCVSGQAPIQNHVVSMITTQNAVNSSTAPALNAKYAIYSLWDCNGNPKASTAQQFEFYDYKNNSNTLEKGNDAPNGANTSASYCSGGPFTASQQSFCDHQSTLGNQTSTGTKTGLISTELDPGFSNSTLANAESNALTNYLAYLKTDYKSPSSPNYNPDICSSAYSPECAQQ